MVPEGESMCEVHSRAPCGRVQFKQALPPYLFVLKGAGRIQAHKIWQHMTAWCNGSAPRSLRIITLSGTATIMKSRRIEEVPLFLVHSVFSSLSAIFAITKSRQSVF